MIGDFARLSLDPRVDPVTRLPSELVQDIFVQAGPASYYQDPNLSLVSRTWRALALETPALWSMIYIRQSGWYVRPSRLHAWLGRTSEHALEVRLELHSELTTDNVSMVYRVLEPYLARRISRFYTYEEYNVLHVFGDFTHRLRNVTVLAIQGYAESSPLPWRRRLVDLPTPKVGSKPILMPNLECLHLCMYPFRAMSAFEAPRLHTLKLECMTIDPQPVLDLIRRSPTLNHLQLRLVVWSRDLDISEWPSREDDGKDDLPKLAYLELPPINHSKTPINTRVSTRVLELCSHLQELRIELSSLFDISSNMHPSGTGSLERLQATLDSDWSGQAKGVGRNVEDKSYSADVGLSSLFSLISLTHLDIIFSHPSRMHSRKMDYDISSLLYALSGDDTGHRSSAIRAPYAALRSMLATSFPLPNLEHLSLILWDLDPNAIRSFLFCRAPDGPRFVARTTGIQGSNRANPDQPAISCKISLICCNFSDGDGSEGGGNKDNSEPSLHRAGYEEFQSFWFYLREKK